MKVHQKPYTVSGADHIQNTLDPVAGFLGSLFEWVITGCNKVLFFRYDPVVTPPEDFYFARYAKDDPGVRGIRGEMAYGLLLFGAGFVVIILFLLGVNFMR